MSGIILQRIIPIILFLLFFTGCAFSGNIDEELDNNESIEYQEPAESLENDISSPGVTDMGRFAETGDEICKMDGKPLFFLFGFTTCPYCRWEKDLIKNVTIPKFRDYVVFKTYELDIQEVTPYDRDIYQKYSSGYVPLIVIGCKYSSSGRGESIGIQNETLLLGRLICDVIEGPKPSFCNS